MRSEAWVLPHRRPSVERARGRGVSGRRPGDAGAGQQVPQLRGGGRGYVRECVCVCVACPLPHAARTEGGGRSVGAQPLKTARRGCGSPAPGGELPGFALRGGGRRRW